MSRCCGIWGREEEGIVDDVHMPTPMNIGSKDTYIYICVYIDISRKVMQGWHYQQQVVWCSEVRLRLSKGKVEDVLR